MKKEHKTEINAYTYKQRIAFKKQGNKTKMIEVMFYKAKHLIVSEF